MLSNDFCYSGQVRDSFVQVVSLYVVGEDRYELHSRRAIIQWASCNLYQSGRIVFPCNARQRPDIAFDGSGLQIVFFCNYIVDLRVKSLDSSDISRMI